MCFIQDAGDHTYQIHWADSLQREQFIRHIETGATVEEWLAGNRSPFGKFSDREIIVMHEMALLAPKNAAEMYQANKDLATLRAMFPDHQAEQVSYLDADVIVVQGETLLYEPFVSKPKAKPVAKTKQKYSFEDSDAELFSKARQQFIHR